MINSDDQMYKYLDIICKIYEIYGMKGHVNLLFVHAHDPDVAQLALIWLPLLIHHSLPSH